MGGGAYLPWGEPVNYCGPRTLEPKSTSATTSDIPHRNMVILTIFGKFVRYLAERPYSSQARVRLSVIPCTETNATRIGKSPAPLPMWPSPVLFVTLNGEFPTCWHHILVRWVVFGCLTVRFMRYGKHWGIQIPTLIWRMRAGNIAIGHF